MQRLDAFTFTVDCGLCDNINNTLVGEAIEQQRVSDAIVRDQITHAAIDHDHTKMTS